MKTHSVLLCERNGKTARERSSRDTRRQTEAHCGAVSLGRARANYGLPDGCGGAPFDTSLPGLPLLSPDVPPPPPPDGCGDAPFDTSFPGLPIFDGPKPLGAIRASSSSMLSSNVIA